MKILGFDYTVDMSLLIREIGALGDCDWDRFIIKIASDVPGQQQEATMLHEILEGLNKHSAVNLTHDQICMLEVQLYQVFDANGVDLSPLFKGAKRE